MLSLSKHGLATRDTLRVAVVAFPHLSNFTDVDALASEPSVDLWFARDAHDLAGADLVILPGTKRTIDDLDWLRARGLAAALAPHLAHGLVFGICGGMQMLGRAIDDPHGVEGGGTRPGLGALSITTTLAQRKTTRAVRGMFRADRLFGHEPAARALEGYEIHVGTTAYDPGIAAAFEHDAGIDGASARNGCVVGTYLHGVLDDDDFRHAFIAAARAACGRVPATAWSWWRRERDARIDRWSAHVRDHCDMAALRDLVRA
jgi:adenosylcobyric acid synthase